MRGAPNVGRHVRRCYGRSGNAALESGDGYSFATVQKYTIGAFTRGASDVVFYILFTYALHTKY